MRTFLSSAVQLALSSAAMLGHASRLMLPRVPSNFQGEIQLAVHAPGTRGAGISMASQKRASLKAKNRAKHKRHVRGS